MNQKKWKVLTFCGIFVVLFGALVGFKSLSNASQLKGLPNYTEIRGEINIKNIQYDKQPSLGDPKAPVKVIEFGDFKCPACKQWTETYFDQFKKEFIDTGKVQFYFMNYAFIDRDSIMAASAGEAIAQQSHEAFWVYYKRLYENQGDEREIWATPSFLETFVKNNVPGIDHKKFSQDMVHNDSLLEVKEDYKLGGSLGINGTPQFVINGKLLNSSSYEELSKAIRQALSI